MRKESPSFNRGVDVNTQRPELRRQWREHCETNGYVPWEQWLTPLEVTIKPDLSNFTEKTKPALSDFEQSMQKLSEVAGATAEQMEQLKAYAEAGYFADDES